MAEDGQDFGEEIGRVDIPHPVETHVDRLGLLRSNRRSRKTDRAFVTDEEERG